MSELDPNSRDRLVSVVKGFSTLIPYVGPIISEVINEIIPNQRFDRVVKFLKALDKEMEILKERLTNFEKNIKTELGSELFHEGILQASRAVSEDKQERLARLLARSMSAPELEYEQGRKLLNLYKELTDPEIVWLIFYSLNPTLGEGPHTKWVEQHPEILLPISRESGVPLEQRERAALQDSWKATLLGLGLTSQRNGLTYLTPLGRLFIRYITNSENDEGSHAPNLLAPHF